MGLITKEVEVGITGNNVAYYENLGYTISKYKNVKGLLKLKKGTKIFVKVQDLQNGSNIKVDIKCDGINCQNPYLKPIVWQNYLKYVNKDGKYYCKKCAINLYGSKNANKTKLKNGKSFEQWCIENNRQDVLDRWDYELNDCKPDNIAYGTGKSFWFKCPKELHKSELKNINKITSHKSSIKCFECTRIAVTHPEYKEYFVNMEDIYKYSYGDHRKVLMQCPICGYQKNKSIADLINRGFGCQRCGNGTSYPERFMVSFLNELNILYKKELSKYDFDWCDRFKYDFYIPHISCIIETHGEQHYKPMRLANKKRTLEEEQNNDIQKKQLALNNNISFYIVLNCEKSEPTWIKNSILNSGLLDILKLQENDINWNNIYTSALTNITKQVCDLYNNGYKQKDISNQLKIHTTTVKTLLKKGSQVGLCNYKPKTKKSVICINTGQIFDSLRKAGEEYQISHSNISECCNGLKDNINGYKFEFL